MIIGVVTGKVVATRKDESLTGRKLLVVQPIDIRTCAESGSTIVAMDTIGAGEGETVMLVTGSSARLAEGLRNKVPTDTSITAIVDEINVLGETVFQRSS